MELHIAQFTFQKMLYVSPSTFQVCSLLFYDTYSLLNPQTEIKYSDTHYKTTFLTFISSTNMGILYMLYYAFFCDLKKKMKLSYHRILKRGYIYLRSHLVQLIARYFKVEWEPHRTNRDC